MKITISMPEGVYKKLESDRGLIPRSTYIQELIKDSDEVVEVTTKTDEEEFEVDEELSTEEEVQSVPEDVDAKEFVKEKEWGGSRFKDSKLNE
jgi:hypothetical protein